MKLYITAPSVFVLIVFYLPVVLWVLWRIGRSPRWRGMKKAGVIILALLLAYAIPLGDVTVNSLAMAKVCPRAGLHIYRTVEVEGFIGHYNVKDRPYQFIEFPTSRLDGTYYWVRSEKNPDGSISVKELVQPTAEYEVLTDSGGSYDQVTHTEKSRWAIQNRITGEVLSEWLFFSALPGWMDRILVYRWFGTGGGALSCTTGSDFSYWEEKALRPKQAKN